MNTVPLLQMRDVGITVGARGNRRTLVRDVDLTVEPGETVGLVGESGSGKSMLVKSAMRLLPRHVEVSGRIDFEGRSVLGFSRRELAAHRCRDVAIVHQDPRAHTNPLRTIGDFLVEGAVAGKLLGPREARQRACELMASIGITDPEHRLAQYPHQLSGGLLQRMMIVAALLPSPKLVFADEPTTALDVTVQSEVMAILQEQIRERKLGLLFISHDLDLAAAVTDSLAVMYAGTIVERGTTAEVYSRPLHPYTAGLLACRPSATVVTRPQPIPGQPVLAYEVGSGCPFAARCSFAIEKCRKDRPRLRTVEDRLVACHRAEQIGAELPQGVHS
ncbi:ABC transporter ATP-binding protein [Streptomyces tendae]|uniref:ABC transporter ATP-binding protein n=1 Tax=Streptomyces tendae TaxID=1932 RepID=UPI0036BBD2FA